MSCQLLADRDVLGGVWLKTAINLHVVDQHSTHQGRGPVASPDHCWWGRK